MKLITILKKLSVACMFATNIINASNTNTIDNIHFLIPGGIGGGWDSTARSVGEVLLKAKLANSVSFENMSGYGGGKALSYLIETLKKQNNTMMINSTPIVIKSLQNYFPQSFRDLTLIASIIADYQVLAVREDSSLKSWNDIVIKFKKNPRKLKIGGGSSRGSLDHIVSAQIFKAAGYDPKLVKYISYDAGGKAFNALISGEIDVLSTGLGEVLEKYRLGKVKIIAVTSLEPIKGIEDIPTFKSLGVDMSFANWRGFFAAPGMSEKQVDKFANILKEMYDTTQWKEVRKKNGWSDLYQPKKEFRQFLEEQEKSISSLMKELGFL
ncbi:tripartite tricarboxylate transporter substrate-binding protein [Halarcobacter ebronensis]|uniref:Tripartite tricarboxylate transporter substrate-binding protein n=1 Tax=Halarcobacter ebronensis TaxID=1462615 RepID=A0A4Q0Y6N4_9BACT|nr:tripartite tricarboxylate transporter substrate-binding protein [Halarcobacter ebronensis]RXJ65365.1 tripartite tricarboxylate transporter substrate-binding protein [Halarcobacter ebronensis]